MAFPESFRLTPHIEMCLVMREFAYHPIVRSRHHCIRGIPALGRSGDPRSSLGLRAPPSCCIPIPAVASPNPLGVAQRSWFAEVVPGVSSRSSSRARDVTSSSQVGAARDHAGKCRRHPNTATPSLDIRCAQAIQRLLITLGSVVLLRGLAIPLGDERPAHPLALHFARLGSMPQGAAAVGP